MAFETGRVQKEESLKENTRRDNQTMNGQGKTVLYTRAMIERDYRIRKIGSTTN